MQFDPKGIRMNAFKYLIAAASLAVTVSAADATVLTFDDYSPAPDFTYPTVINYGGLTFTADPASVGVQSVWDSNSPNSNGTNNLIYGYGAGITITQTGGGVFDLLSLDMSISWYDANLTEDIFINGTLYTLGQGIASLTTNLLGVSSVTITGLSDGYWLADNIETSASAVPVPASLPLLLVALGGLGVAARRRKTA
jgi:hypothetical protein